MRADRRVFISHVHEERGLGAVVKEWVDGVFDPYGVTAFLSSDRRDLKAGERWRDVILQQMESAIAVVSLISPLSMARPWVNIELGAAWCRGLPVIPLCHSGQTLGGLPPPFGDFHGVDLQQSDAAHRLLDGIAAAAQVRLSAKLGYADFLSQMRSAQVAQATIAAADVVAAPSSPNPEQLVILQFLSVVKQHGRGDDLSLRQIASQTGLTPAIVEIELESLEDMGFVGTLYNMNTGASHYIETKGLKLLRDLGQLP